MEKKLSNKKKYNGLLLTNSVSSRNEHLRIAPLLYFIGIPFIYKDFKEILPNEITIKKENRYDLIIANYVFSGLSPAEYEMNSDVVQSLLRTAVNGTTVIVSDFMIYWLGKKLSIEYRGIENNSMDMHIKFKDGKKVKIKTRNFAVIIPEKVTKLQDCIIGNFEKQKQTLLYGEIKYGKGKFVVLNSLFMRYLYSYGEVDPIILERIMKRLDKVLNSILLLRFFGWKYGKEMALAIRIDDIFPMMQPTIIANLKKLDFTLKTHKLKATYGATPFGGEKWFAEGQTINNFFLKIMRVMTKVPFLNLLPYSIYFFWVALWKTLMKQEKWT